MIELLSQPFSPWDWLMNYEQTHPPGGHSGANNIFIGTMRDFNQGEQVRAMWLEHYPGMTEKQLTVIAESALRQWPLHDLVVVHRIGEILPSHTIVVIAAWSAHREEAFAACRYVTEALKHDAPFWKRETLSSGQQRWVASV